MRNKLLDCVSCAEQPPGFLPAVYPEDLDCEDPPFLGLLNPSSGNKAGAVILQEAQFAPAYKQRFFNIVEVASDAEVAEAFREMLEQTREEAVRKTQNLGGDHRPRLICGGGDGTASFALWCIFRALRAEDGGLRWSDEDLERYFPAFAQLPLGTGNDFAGTLGWGRTIDPVNDRGQAQEWFRNALNPRLVARPFDVWGLFPTSPQSMKVCALAGMDEKLDRPQFKVAGDSVPFLTLLYISLGYEAFVAAQVECKRTDTRLGNGVEYSKAVIGSLIGTKRVNVDLTGITIQVPAGSGVGRDLQRQYFPPTHRTSTGEEFSSIGFMNINSYSGGLFAASEPAMLSDGLLDLFRQKNPAKNTLKRGLRWRTEKFAWARFQVPPSLPGAFVQYDGEARFLFDPVGQGVGFDARHVMRIPVLVGCQLEYRRGLEPSPTDGQQPAFHFVGSDEEKAEFKQRLEAWVTKRLAVEMNASQEEVECLQATSSRWFQGVCARSRRIFYDFGTTIMGNKCAKCGASVANKGCKGCHRRFCPSCWLLHLGDVPQVQWMYEDANTYFPEMAKWNPQRWSSRLCLADAIPEMEAEKSGRPIHMRVYVQEKEDATESFGDSSAATEWLKSRLEEVEREPVHLGGGSDCSGDDWDHEDCTRMRPGSVDGSIASGATSIGS